MIYEPLILFPSKFAGDGFDVIDATVANTFSAQVRCSGTIGSYQVAIMQNDTDSTTVYTSEVVTLDSPFSPYNRDGEPNTLTVSIPADSGITNNYENGYKWRLTLWETYSSEDPASTRFIGIDNFFWAKSPSSAEVSSVSTPATIISRTNIFQATYTSPDAVRWFQWELAQVVGGEYREIYRGPRVYSNDVGLKYDSLVSGNHYAIRVTVYNQSNVETVSDWKEFDVTYSTEQVVGLTTIEQVNDGIRITWSGIQYIVGVARYVADDTESTNYEILDNTPVSDVHACDIDADTYLYFSSSQTFSLDLDDEKTTVLETKINHYDTNSVLLVEVESEDGEQYRKLEHVGFVRGLQPSESLAPSEALAPSDGYGGYFKYTNSESEVFYAETLPGPLNNSYFNVAMYPSDIKVNRQLIVSGA